MTDISSDESNLKVLRLLQSDPILSQRDLSQALGISLGKANYCIRALMDKGLLKTRSVRSSGSSGYAYTLTPAGIVAKANLTRAILKTKIREYELLRREIEELRKDVESEN